MQTEHKNVIDHHINGETITIRGRQAPLRAQYSDHPDHAWIIDRATTTSGMIHPNHPIHGHVVFGDAIPASQPVSAHKALGGESDFPCPGEILAAAIASCLDTSTRMIANILGITLEHLAVTVDLGVDVRGTLMMEQKVPVGFQTVDITCDLTPTKEITDAQISMLMNAAERSCVILQTLRHPPAISMSRNIGKAGQAPAHKQTP